MTYGETSGWDVEHETPFCIASSWSCSALKEAFVEGIGSVRLQATRARKVLARQFRSLEFRSKHLSNRGLAALFGAFVLMLLLNSWLAYQSTQAHARTDDRIAHTELVLGDLEAIANNLDNAESGQRGYILTGIESYLAPYTTSKANIAARISALDTHLDGDPAQQVSFAQLTGLVNQKYAEMQHTVDLRRNNQTQQAEQIVLSGQGQQLMDEIRRELATMRSREEVLLANEETDAHASLTEITVTFAFAAVVDLALLAIIGWLVYRTLEERTRLLDREREAVHLRDQFLSIASHELKTPLTSLLINAQLLERRAAREGREGEANRRSSEAIVRQTRRLRSLIDAMLDVSRIATGQLSIQREQVDLASLAHTAVSEVEASTDRHIITFQGADTVVSVDGDRMRLEEVVLNLLQNAIKYSPNGGTITLRLYADEANAYLCVQDPGIGIPAEALPHLFDRFYRASNAQSERISGMGIGLSVVHDVVALHGGDITVESTEGEGSTFTIRLPLASAAPVAASIPDIGGLAEYADHDDSAAAGTSDKQQAS